MRNIIFIARRPTQYSLSFFSCVLFLCLLPPPIHFHSSNFPSYFSYPYFQILLLLSISIHFSLPVVIFDSFCLVVHLSISLILSLFLTYVTLSTLLAPLSLLHSFLSYYFILLFYEVSFYFYLLKCLSVCAFLLSACISFGIPIFLSATGLQKNLNSGSPFYSICYFQFLFYVFFGLLSRFLFGNHLFSLFLVEKMSSRNDEWPGVRAPIFNKLERCSLVEC